MKRIQYKRPSLSLKNKKKQQTKSTKSFRVKADLGQHPTATPATEQLQQSAKTPPSPHLASSSHSEASAATSSSTDLSALPKTTTHNNSNNTKNNHGNRSQRYLRGGGYCSHRNRTYEERWSEDHVNLVVDSWQMTPKQRDKLLDLQERLRDVDHYLNCPHQLVYFLKDELGNVDLAEKFFRKNVQTRQESPYQMDSILEDYELPDDYDYFPMAVLQGTDKEGLPIQITRTGAADCWGLYRRHGRDAMIHHAIYNQELEARGAWVDDYEAAQGKKATQFTVVFDLQGLSARHMRPGLLPVCGTVARILQDNYPEIVKRVLIIRSPYLFKTIWSLIKHFFDPELRELMVFGTSDANSQHVMEQFIDPDVLPHCVHPGGKDGPLARGYEHVKMEGGMIPPEGEYKTPRDIGMRQSQTRVDTMSDLSDTMVTSNVRTAPASNRVSSRGAPVKPKCTKLLSGSFDFVPIETKSASLVAQDFRALINIDRGSHMLIGLN